MHLECWIHLPLLMVVFFLEFLLSSHKKHWKHTCRNRQIFLLDMGYVGRCVLLTWWQKYTVSRQIRSYEGMKRSSTLNLAEWWTMKKIGAVPRGNQRCTHALVCSMCFTVNSSRCIHCLIICFLIHQSKRWVLVYSYWPVMVLSQFIVWALDNRWLGMVATCNRRPW